MRPEHVKVSAMGFEPMRGYLQWILGPPLDHSGRLTVVSSLEMSEKKG